jgi:uncharacterized membrane protein
MNEMFVAVFNTEDEAIKGIRTLKDLHQEGGISLYSWAVIVKDPDGPISVKQDSGQPHVGTALGLLLGGIVGILGGPAGTAVGASIGGYVGLLADWARYGIDLKFLDDVGKTLGPGKAAILAEIEQSWISVIETRMEEQGATVFRRFRTDVMEDQLLEEERVHEKELQDLIDQLDGTDAASRATLEKRMAGTKQQLAAIQDRAKVGIAGKKAEMDLKVRTLLAQAETAAAAARSQIETRIEEAKADFEIRSKKLNQAWSLAKRALSQDQSGRAA